MKKKMSLIIIGILIIFIGVWVYFYINYFTNTAILKNIANGEGYSMNIGKKPIDIELMIQPEWIPFESDKPKDINVKLYKKYIHSIGLFLYKKASSVFEEAFLCIAHYESYHKLELKSSNFFDTQYNGITGMKDPNSRRLSMNSNVSAWYEKKEHINEMKGWDKGKLKIWEQQVTNNFPVGAKILDIGSGMGREAFALYRQGFEVNGLDVSKDVVDKANEEAVKRDSKVKFYHYDGEHIPFGDGMFDVIIIWSQTFGLLYGQNYKDRFLKECKRVLKSEGLLSYSGHSLQYLREYHNDCLEDHKFYPYLGHDIYWETFSLEELEDYTKKAGYDIVISGEGEIYVPEDGIVLYCLSKVR